MCALDNICFWLSVIALLALQLGLSESNLSVILNWFWMHVYDVEIFLGS